jgi:DNA-binding MarR family transcriptional regulator
MFMEPMAPTCFSENVLGVKRAKMAFRSSDIPPNPAFKRGTLTMQGVKHNGDEKLTLLELVLRVQGEFRRSLEPIRVTPLQAGVVLYLQRHPDTKLTDAATALCLRLPTISTVVKDLVRKRWVTKRRSVTDDRALCLSLSRQGQALARKIEVRIRDVGSALKPMKEASL